jgi:hypothetical protein
MCEFHTMRDINTTFTTRTGSRRSSGTSRLRSRWCTGSRSSCPSSTLSSGSRRVGLRQSSRCAIPFLFFVSPVAFRHRNKDPAPFRHPVDVFSSFCPIVWQQRFHGLVETHTILHSVHQCQNREGKWLKIVPVGFAQPYHFLLLTYILRIKRRVCRRCGCAHFFTFLSVGWARPASTIFQPLYVYVLLGRLLVG